MNKKIPHEWQWIPQGSYLWLDPESYSTFILFFKMPAEFSQRTSVFYASDIKSQWPWVKKKKFSFSEIHIMFTYTLLVISKSVVPNMF